MGESSRVKGSGVSMREGGRERKRGAKVYTSDNLFLWL